MANTNTEQIHFSYKSIGNFAKLLATILYEKEHSGKEITLWHLRYDNDEADDLFEQFLNDIFPDRGMLNIEEIQQLMNYAANFLLKDQFLLPLKR